MDDAIDDVIATSAMKSGDVLAEHGDHEEELTAPESVVARMTPLADLSEPVRVIGALCVSFGVTFLLIPHVRRLAIRTSFYDEPGRLQEALRAHAVPRRASR